MFHSSVLGAASCITDVWLFVYILLWFAHIGGAATLLLSSIWYRLPISDLSYEEVDDVTTEADETGQTVLVTTIDHWLLPSKQTAPIYFSGTGHPMLDGHKNQNKYFAKTLTTRKLCIVDGRGLPCEKGLETSCGVLHMRGRNALVSVGPAKISSSVFCMIILVFGVIVLLVAGTSPFGIVDKCHLYPSLHPEAKHVPFLPPHVVSPTSKT
jgi:hypothetical protein